MGRGGRRGGGTGEEEEDRGGGEAGEEEDRRRGKTGEKGEDGEDVDREEVGWGGRQWGKRRSGGGQGREEGEHSGGGGQGRRVGQGRARVGLRAEAAFEVCGLWQGCRAGWSCSYSIVET